MERFDVRHAHVQVDKHQKIRTTEIVRLGQTLDNWTEIITIRAFGAKNYPSPREAASAMRQILTKRCPSLVWNDLEVRDEDVLYEWRIENCGSDPDQHQIGRFAKTKSTVFHAFYCTKTKPLPPRNAEWIMRFQSAKIEK